MVTTISMAKMSSASAVTKMLVPVLWNNPASFIGDIENHIGYNDADQKRAGGHKCKGHGMVRRKERIFLVLGNVFKVEKAALQCFLSKKRLHNLQLHHRQHQQM